MTTDHWGSVLGFAAAVETAPDRGHAGHTNGATGSETGDLRAVVVAAENTAKSMTGQH